MNEKPSLPANPRYWPDPWRGIWEVKAAGFEFDDGKIRPEAERLAEEIVRREFGESLK